MPHKTTHYKSGFVALIGRPNAGKSTLINTLVGSKVSIVTHKAQTTRRRILGMLTTETSQMIFVDTPGIFSPKGKLDRQMVDTARASLVGADIGLVVVDANTFKASEALIQSLPADHPCLCLVLNKIDRLPREKLLEVAAHLNALRPFFQTFMISALTGDGVNRLVSFVETQLPDGPHLYPEDQLCDLSQRQMVAELTREHLILNFHEELPYFLTVMTESWEEFNDGSVKITQVIYVDRPQHKPIILGKHGQAIKNVSQRARAAISAWLERPVHLFLYVKVQEKWTEKPALYSDLGLDFGIDLK